MRKIFALVVFAGCVGKAPSSPPGDDEPPMDPDAPPAPVTGAPVSGKAIDYFGNVAMEGSVVTTDGVTPAMMATSATGGMWSLDNVPAGSKVFLSVTKSGYRSTRNPVVAVDTMPVTQDVYQMAIADVNRQYTTLGKTPDASKGFVVAELFRNDGTPVPTIALTDISIVDGAGVAVPNVLPVAFGTAGDVDGTLLTATLINTKTRVAFLDLPPGSYTIKLNLPDGAGGIKVQDTPVVAMADAATLVKTGAMVTAATGPNVTNPTFATDVYPTLQKAAKGGLGCGTCHTAGGPAAVLPFDDAASAVMTRLTATLGVIDATTPANSLFLSKPLYELPPTVQNHPNATFIDVNDPYYKMYMAWISQGLKP